MVYNLGSHCGDNFKLAHARLIWKLLAQFLPELSNSAPSSYYYTLDLSIGFKIIGSLLILPGWGVLPYKKDGLLIVSTF